MSSATASHYAIQRGSTFYNGLFYLGGRDSDSNAVWYGITRFVLGETIPSGAIVESAVCTISSIVGAGANRTTRSRMELSGNSAVPATNFKNRSQTTSYTDEAVVASTESWNVTSQLQEIVDAGDASIVSVIQDGSMASSFQEWRVSPLNGSKFTLTFSYSIPRRANRRREIQ
ncbi:hypothetical protein Pan189_41490 [Stratiformator vulcanicus]|uniref:Uncharacterized protein n=1 Tax=Stratiformator vulcanicus TaxID=2527980 RepID=A0A517R779_9PLAN|nr:hypothetical protein Pan189_41490 [Stratiformator vulcanicus]